MGRVEEMSLSEEVCCSCSTVDQQQKLAAFEMIATASL